MVMEINGKVYSVVFGLKFLRELDLRHNVTTNGLKFGTGLEQMAYSLYANDPLALSETLYTGTSTEKTRPTAKQVDDYIENHESIEELIAEVIEELKKSNVCRTKMKAVEETLSIAEKEMANH